MPCATNPWQFYSQCTGVSPGWYVQNDGCNNPCGCLPIVQSCAPLRRRFSPYCRVIDVTSAAPQVYLRVAPSPQADSLSLTFTQSQVQLQLRRKGCETVIATYPAWRRDENGYIGFFFDDALFGAPKGYYIGDVYIDCCYCFSVTLRLAPCLAVVTDCYVQPALQTCGAGMCGVLVPAGFGVVGGLLCAAANDSTCGGIAPFFPITNPPPPVPVCSTGSACCYVPATAAGAVAAG